MFESLNRMIDKYVTRVPQYDEEDMFCECCGFSIYEGDTYYRYGKPVPGIYCAGCIDDLICEAEAVECGM